MDIDGNNVQMISQGFDRNIRNITWRGDGKIIYFQYDSEGMTRIASITLSGKVKDIVDELGAYHLEGLIAALLYHIKKW